MLKRYASGSVRGSVCDGDVGCRHHRREWSGSVAIEARLFASAPLDHRQSNHSFSLAAETEYYVESESGRNSLLFKSFIRGDNADSHRTHFDVRELIWQYVGDTWELRAGIGKVFWGVTEGQHLVDIINQTDLVESSDGETSSDSPWSTWR